VGRGRNEEGEGGRKEEGKRKEGENGIAIYVAVCYYLRE